MKQLLRAVLRLSRRGSPGSARTPVTCAAIFCLLANSALAQDLDRDRLQFRGFGTVGAVTHDAEGIEFRRNVTQAGGPETHEWDLGTDSLAGLQMDLRLSEDFDLVGQALIRQRSDGDWTPVLSQGFLRYSPDDSVVLRAGRIGYDIYLLAESRQVGFSYLAVRPSPEFYGQITNDNIDGGDVAITRRLGRALVKARLFGGSTTTPLAFADGSTRNPTSTTYGATFDYSMGGWTARAALLQVKYDSDPGLALLVAGLRATGIPSALVVADDFDKKAFTSKGAQLGVAYDEGPLLAQLLYGRIYTDSSVGPDLDLVYALVGRRFGRWTPFISYASSADRDELLDAGLPPIPQLAPLSAAVQAAQDFTRATQHSSTLGLRFDINSKVDFKIQYDRTHVRNSSLMFDRRVTDVGRPFDMNVVSATVDFVF